MLHDGLSKSYTYQFEPDEQGGRTRTVTINRQNVLPIAKREGRKKTPRPTAYVLLGFDTEYQTFNPVTGGQLKAGEGTKNEILSYQFSVKVVSSDERDDEPLTRGIVIPKKDQRIALEEFIGCAIGSLIDAHPDIMVPPDIYLVGHFTRADLPGFVGFADQARRYMDNIRGSFVSLAQHLPLEIKKGGLDEPVCSFRLRVRDTMLLAPTNAKSLAAVGKIVGFEKITLHDDPGQEQRIKENMAEFRTSHWDRFRDYAIRDADVCVQYAERILRQHQKLFGEFNMPVTLTGFGTTLALKGWESQGLSADAILGKETVVEQTYSRRQKGLRTRRKSVFQEKVHFEYPFIIETYHGGRNEQFVFGAAPEGDWHDHDLSSAYGTAMSLIGMPDWDGMRYFDQSEGNHFDLEHVDPLELGFFAVEFEFPEAVRFPALPVRTEHGIIFPRKGYGKSKSMCSAPELVLAHRLGAQLNVIKAVRVPTDRDKPVFTSFMKECIEERNRHASGTFDNQFWKEVGNSTYGKTAQGLRQKRVYDLRDDDMVMLKESPLTQPYFASFITSFTRAVLGEILNGFPAQVEVFSVTTDGFLSNASHADIAQATRGPLFKAFAKARRELAPDDDKALEVKHWVRQPIGWRTRGSATLKPGARNDKNIVLQKGGIKVSEAFDSDVLENSHIVQLFLNREPDSIITYTTGLSVKDIIRNDADFVSRDVIKKLSMEYDWKRRPCDQHDAAITFEGRAYSHLSFRTKPLEDKVEFDRLRERWEKYANKPRRILKTLQDLQNFLAYVETNKDPDKQVTRYLKKDGGDLERLKRDLTRAYQHGQAGFDRVKAARKVRHADVVKQLIACGIPCKLSDIDNGKRFAFIPNQTPRTARVMEAIQRLRDDYFPELEIDQILVRPE